ncbi:hypothetical protein J3R30DRAFT_1129222 [Lentinula aciculospora]|uniref:Uncharacterized protein n=1 Tax=Lentinula aciculospora TaxID=153920 RepID=A0A9W8ZZC1_9AGAR|nr:hypothetical protein J3R30DRAFT_1129222 [Lentinula aciculospora]
MTRLKLEIIHSSRMTEPSPLAQHPPAVKVGGRRLSINLKPHHRPQLTSKESDERETSALNNSEHSRTNTAGPPSPPFDDYPRPTRNEEDQEHIEHREEVPHPRKDQKHGHGSIVGGVESYASIRRGEETMPTRDHYGAGAGKSFGAGGRIVQPEGKGL